MLKTLFPVALIALTVGTVGCSSKAGNVAVGAGAAGAAYEYSNKRAMDQLDEDLKGGKISKEEYDRQRQDIEKRSVIQ